MELDKKRLLRLLAYTLVAMSALMVPSLVVSVGYQDPVIIRAFLYPFALSMSIGLVLLFFVPPSKRHMKIRDGYMGIFTILLVSIISGAFPYYLGHPGCSFISAIFESTAGISTTSASVLGEVNMHFCLLLWKSIEHWVGGIAVLAFILSILPLLGNGDQQLATAEGHGAFLNKVAPKQSQIIRYVSIVYVFLTFCALIFFLFTVHDVRDAIILALSTASTSGVLLHPEGISYYDSTAVEMGISFFCILSGMNFVLFVNMYNRNFKAVKENIELRTYLGIIFVATVFTTGILYITTNNDKGFLQSLSDSFFQVSSFASTSGFALEDYTLWPPICIFVLIALMIVGGCTASTTGSFKILRLLIVLQLISRGITKRIHPRAVKTMKIGNSKLSANMVSSVSSFSMTYIAILLFSIVVLSLQNLDLETTISAALGTISNNGISFGNVGMDADYSFFHPILQLFLCLLMIIGRLGVVSVLIIFLPSFWNPNKRTHFN